MIRHHAATVFLLILFCCSANGVAYSQEIELRDGACIASFKARKTLNDPIEFRVATEDHENFELVFVRNRRPLSGQIVVGDKRTAFDRLTFRRSEAKKILDLFEWKFTDLMEASDGFHFTARIGRVFSSATFEKIYTDQLFNRMKSQCHFGPSVAELRTRELGLALDPTQIRLVNWILGLRDGFVDPARVLPTLNTSSRDRLERQLPEIGFEGRYLDDRSYRAVLGQGGFKIPPVYDFAGQFSGGLAVAEIAGKWGLLRPDGSWAIPPSFDAMDKVINGVAPFQMNDHWGLINRNLEVLSPVWPEIRHCDDGRCPFLSTDGRWGFFDTSGAMVVGPKYKEVDDYREGHAAVRDDKGWLVIDLLGNTKRIPGVSRLYSPAEGKLLFVDKSGRRGFIDLRGRVVSPGRYEIGQRFSDGYAGVRTKKVWGYVDHNGSQVIRPQYKRVGLFSNNRAPAQSSSGKWGYLDKRGRWAISPKFPRAFGFHDGIAIVRWPNPTKPGSEEPEDLRRGFIGVDGEWYFPPIFEDAYSFSEGLAPVKFMGKWGYISEDLVDKLPDWG